MEEKYVAILFEEMKGDIKQVLEGHQVLYNEITRTREVLREEIKLNTIRIEALDEKLSNRIDALASDLKAHRADTEAHHGIYQVKES